MNQKTRYIIEDYLVAKGVRTDIIGFAYLVEAIDRFDIKLSLTKDIYEGIASDFNTTKCSIERAIRYARINCKEPANTNGEFISLCSLYVNRIIESNEGKQND